MFSQILKMHDNREKLSLIFHKTTAHFWYVTISSWWEIAHEFLEHTVQI